MLHTRFRGNRPDDSGEDFLRVFTIYVHGGHLGHVNSIMCRTTRPRDNSGKTTRTNKSRTKTTRPSSRDNSAQFKRQLGPNENSIFDSIIGIYRRSIKHFVYPVSGYIKLGTQIVQ